MEAVPTSQKPKQRVDLYQQVTDKIVQQLEQGTIPWCRPWKGADDRMIPLPLNTVTGKNYRGINIVLLWCTALARDFRSSEWATFKQWQQKNEQIRKGEKGSMIVYYDTFEKEVEGELQKIPFLKSSVVFNRCQLQSYEPPVERPSEHDELLAEKIAPLDDFLTNIDVTVEHIGSSACYVPSKDVIYMPAENKFVHTATCTATEGYYSTLLHEVGHWTGAEHRLNRKFGKRFGDNDYAVEELVAELTAAFLCAEFLITTIDKGDHAAYIAHWLKVLKDNKYIMLAAASEASKAVDYLHSLQIESN